MKTGSGLADTTPQPLHTHPRSLEEIDRAYFAVWGRPQILFTLTASVLALGACGALVLLSPYCALGFLVVLPLSAFFVLFFRNPTRRIPEEEALVVAPADGTIWDVEQVNEEQFVGGPCQRVGIFLSVFNVHVNRAPVSGRVEYLQHRDGAFRDARSAAASRVNESNSIGMVTAGGDGPAGVKILIKQISGAIARRIICPNEVGTLWRRGGLIGMIKYGSRTELYLPVDSGVEVVVRVGDKVRGGETIVARLPRKAD